MNPIDIDRSLYRYKRARNEIGTKNPDGRVLGHIDFKPMDKSFPEAEIFMGSHIDRNPNTDDRVEVWNSRPENGRTLIHQEVFVETTERVGWSLKKTPVLHVIHHALYSPGNVFVGAAMATIDLNTGKPIRSLVDDEAARKIGKMGYWEPDRHAPHDAESMKGWMPEPVPDYLDPDEIAKNRAEVTNLRDGITGALAGGSVKEGKDSVTFGQVTLPRRDRG